MLERVFLVFYLFCLSCFAEYYPPSFVKCDKLNSTNCGPFYCMLVPDTASTVPNAVKCVEDPCFAQSYPTDENDSPKCSNIAGTVCKHSVFNNGTNLEVCVSGINHFSDCRLTNGPLTSLYAGEDSNFPKLENFCRVLGCGGAYMYFDDNDKIYFHCEEPGEDGTEGPDDFNVENCKKFEYAVNTATGLCDWDPCSFYVLDETTGDVVNESGDPCPSGSCQVLDTIAGKLCIRANETVCGVGSWNLPSITSDGCATMGCGGLDVAKSMNGDSYLFCRPAPAPTPECPKKNGASYLRVATIILATTIFAFL